MRFRPFNYLHSHGKRTAKPTPTIPLQNPIEKGKRAKRKFCAISGHLPHNRHSKYAMR